MATERRVKVAAIGAVTLFDHLFRLPTLRPELDTVFVPALGGRAGTTYFGGCGLNQAVAVGRLGVPATALGVVGKDVDDSGYADHLRRHGVETDLLTRVDAPSGHSYILHAADGGTLLVVEEGAATQGEWSAPAVRLPDDVLLLLVNMPFDAYAVEAARQAVELGAAVLIAGQLGTAEEGVRRELARLATYLCCNRVEAASLGLDDEAVVAEQFPRLQGRWVTAGAAGLQYVGADGERFDVPAAGGDVVDPTGAGDGVVGGLAAGLALGLDLADATRLGALTASFVIGSVGAQTGAPDLAACAERWQAIYGPLPERLAALVESSPGIAS